MIPPNRRWDLMNKPSVLEMSFARLINAIRPDLRTRTCSNACQKSSITQADASKPYTNQLRREVVGMIQDVLLLLTR
jgi:hypothetical protein